MSKIYVHHSIVYISTDIAVIITPTFIKSFKTQQNVIKMNGCQYFPKTN